MSKNFKILLYIFLITGSLYFIFIGLTHGKGFLIPLITAIILAMIMAPVAAKFHSWGLSRGLAVLLADLVVVVFIAFMVFLLAAQANQVASNWSQIEKRMKPKIEQTRQFLNQKLKMDLSSLGQPAQNIQDSTQQSQGSGNPQNARAQQEEQGNQQQQMPSPAATQEKNSSNSGSSAMPFNTDQIRQKLTSIIRNLFSFLSQMLLVLIYTFFFLYYKDKFKNTVIGMVHEGKQEQARDILEKSAKAAQNYLLGRFILILILAMMYMAGWSLIGLKYAIFIALISALFSLVPYVGNFLALMLAIAMSFVSGGGTGQIIAIVGIFAVAQFVESYILEPFVVGSKVDINPVMVIVGVVLGGIVWGVMGMLLAIPILGILKVILDNIQSLRPLGYALDERDISSGGKEEKIKNWIMDKAKKAGIKKS